jgi:GLPGLI family protein
MKKILLLLAFAAVAVQSSAQVHVISPEDAEKGTACDRLKFIISYEMQFVNDTVRKPYHYIKEVMWLKIGRQNVSHFYSRSMEESDSINNEKMKRGESDFFGGGNVSWRLYRNYPEKGKYAYLESVGNDRLVYKEKVEMPRWEIVSDSVQTILGYRCVKATADYRGRKWSAWYTEDIPLDEGPWKLKGLPGLILKAEDSGKQYVFIANGMQQPKDGGEIFYKGDKYAETSRAGLDKIMRSYYYDPVSYMSNDPHMKVEIIGEGGERVTKPMDSPYNPIERDCGK